MIFTNEHNFHECWGLNTTGRSKKLNLGYKLSTVDVMSLMSPPLTFQKLFQKKNPETLS